ncbi:Metal resistance protein YCF1 [Verticillium dahliae VDG1]|nr:Metal resistance protein YCF1 [Verticillium dahliae VDG1]
MKWLEECFDSQSKTDTAPHLLGQQDESDQEESGSQSGDQSGDDQRADERHEKEKKVQILRNAYICVIATPKGQKEERIKSDIRALGGQYQTAITKKTTHLCASQDQFDSLHKDIVRARDKGIPAVDLSWLTNTLNLKQVINTDSYVLRSGKETRSKGSQRRSKSPKHNGTSDEESSEEDEESDEEQYGSPARSNTWRSKKGRLATPLDSEDRRSTIPAKISDLF